LAGLSAVAQHASAATNDYRALVCLFMHGGNDSHNWLVPMEPSALADYTRARGPLALGAHQLIPMDTAPSQGSGVVLGLAPELAPLHRLYESGELAFVANVGALQQPTTRADFNAGRYLPPKLFSHNDQASYWQSLGPEGTRTGWGGRIADAVQALNGTPTFTAVSAAGSDVFLSGISARRYQVSTSGPIAIEALGRGLNMQSSTATAALIRAHAIGSNSLLEAAYTDTVRRSALSHGALSEALSRVPEQALPTAQRLPDGSTLALDQQPLMHQLRIVSRMIAAAPSLGVRRQVFLVSMSGFDTHGRQARDHPRLGATVAYAAAWFIDALRAAGMHRQVTLFTASDFGRTLTTNGMGTDHGWGSHHFVAGGAVRGRDVYGRFPTLAMGSADEVGSGRLLPSTSVSSYAATLATWMGVPASELATVLPSIGRFGGSGVGFI
jgi:uncharacterized protein (DUF1501 family)